MSYFVSYYDYYQPEAYIPQRDIYIEKDASINEEIDRHAAGDDQLAGEPAGCDRGGERVVHLWLGVAGGLQGDDGRRWRWATCSTATRCWRSWSIFSTSGTTPIRRGASFACGAIRSRSGRATRSSRIGIEFWGDEVERLSIINPTSGEVIDKLEQVYIYPAKHFVLPEERIHGAVDDDSQGAATSGWSCSSRRASCWRPSG